MGMDNVIQVPLTGSSLEVVAQPSSPDAVTGGFCTQSNIWIMRAQGGEKRRVPRRLHKRPQKRLSYLVLFASLCHFGTALPRCCTPQSHTRTLPVLTMTSRGQMRQNVSDLRFILLHETQSCSPSLPLP